MSANLRAPLTSTAARGCGGLVAVVFFGIFLAAGLFFEGLVARDFLRTAQTYRWPALPCRIESSRVVDTDAEGRPASEYRVEIQYCYTVRGASYTSAQFALGQKTFSDYGEAQRLVRRYAAGSQAVCYVNPRAPDQAILRRGSLWFGFALLFPLIFVAIGGGGAFFTIRAMIRGGRAAAAGASAPPSPLSERAGASGRKLALPFFGLFLAVGLAVFYVMTLRPLWQIWKGQSWVRTPCTVVSSEVRNHPGEDGTTYSVNILYAYEVGGQEYRANRYHFMGGSSSGYEGKARVVRRYPPGSRTFCYVNPLDPTDAVLERGPTADMWFGLLPLIFVFVGGGGIFFMLRRKKPAEGPSLGLRSGTTAAVGSRSGLLTGTAAQDERAELPTVLKPGIRPVAKLLAAVLVAAFWNGIVSVFVWQAVQSWLRHRPEWFLTIFVIPFVVVGLIMLGFVVRTFLALFNPRPVLVVSPGVVALGRPLEIKWELAGRAHVVQRLTIHLEGREEAQYQRGTSTCTDKSVFASLPLVDTADRLAVPGGSIKTAIPAGLMHSWASEHNKIVWALKVRGVIEWWPDVDEEFPLTVQPQPPQPGTKL